MRPPYGGHPRIFIWGLLEARLQRADLVVLGGLNEGVMAGASGARPVAPAEGPREPRHADARFAHRPCRARFRERSRRARSADHPGAARRPFADRRLALPAAARRDQRRPAARPQARTDRPRRSTTRARRGRSASPGPRRPPSSGPTESRSRPSTGSRPTRSLSMPRQSSGCGASIRSMPTIPRAWKGSAVHEAFEQWLAHDHCDPDKLRPRAERLLAGRGDPPDAARLVGAAAARGDRLDRGARARQPGARAAARSRPKPTAKPRSPESPSTAAPTGSTGSPTAASRSSITRPAQPPTQKAVDAGFALQLGLLGLIGRAGGFEGVGGDPTAFEYWSLTRDQAAASAN